MGKLLTAPTAPEKLASSGQVIEFSQEIRSFPRLEQALGQELETLDEAQVPEDWQSRLVTGVLEFSFADAQSQGEVRAEVEANASVPLVCQRSLEPFDQVLEVIGRLEFVADDKTPVGDGWEAWELDDELLRPAELVDELFVMAIPFAPRKADSDQGEFAEESLAGESRDTIRPFADLRAQIEAAKLPDDPAEGQDVDKDQH